MSKTYTLLSSEPLTDFENDVVKMLQEMSDYGFQPRAAAVVVMDAEGNVGTYYHNANLSDMMVMRGFLDLDIQTDYLDANYPELGGWDEDEEGGG